MNKTVLSLLVLLLSATASFANAVHLNPARSSSSYSMRTFGDTKMPIGYYNFCSKYPSECETQPSDPFFVLTRERWQQILEVNFRANSEVAPRSDMQVYGVEEAWEFPQTEGDCEDYVLLKKKRLVELGFPAAALLITVALDANRGGHAVLTVATDRGDFILDNLESKVLLWKDAEIYYLKRQSSSDPNTWESLLQG